MPIDKNKYPLEWKKIVAKIARRSGGRCECTGECGLHTTTGRCTERNGERAKYAQGMIILTTAHLCHDPACEDTNHMKHCCQRCHLRIDVEEHRQHARETRRNKKATYDLIEKHETHTA